MIPKNIRRNHILSAVQEIDRDGVPDRRQSRKYQLEVAGRFYPPKYVVALANKYANGEYLKSSRFNGGAETNGFLRGLGFTIVDKKPAAVRKLAAPERKIRHTKKKSTRHTERCPDCKKTVEAMLEKIYGHVESNYRFELGVLPEDFTESAQYQALKRIFSALQNQRGYQQFVRTQNLPRVDYYIPDPGFIVELDESQHFTSARKTSLQHYPESIKVGFNTEKWMRLCDQIQASDHDPPFRDEQRAWYDTLRDFMPAIKGLKPTIRLYAGDFRWCSLDPDQERDQAYFRTLLSGNPAHYRIEVRCDPAPDLARIIIAGKWEGDRSQAGDLLDQVISRWPENKRVDCLITCGAFINFPIPSALPEIVDNKYPNRAAVKGLIDAAEAEARKLLTEARREKLLEHTAYLTLGADSRKDRISLSNVQIREAHIELVALVNLRENSYHWTGKSYPTGGQQEGLIRIRDHDSHFQQTPFGKVFLLGCHDLAVFHPRGKAVTKSQWRIDIRSDFYQLLNEEKPEIILHHPHTTDSTHTWQAAWNELSRSCDSIDKYLGAGIYYREEGERSSLPDVLDSTKRGQSIDFVVYPNY